MAVFNQNNGGVFPEDGPVRRSRVGQPKGSMGIAFRYYGNPQIEVTFLQRIEVGVMGVWFEEEH